MFKQWIGAKLFDFGAWLMMKAADLLLDIELFEFEDDCDCILDENGDC